MLGHLIRKEFLDQILGFRFLMLAGLGACVIWLSLYDGYAYYRDRLKDYRTAQATAEARILQLKEADDWQEFHDTGYGVHKPPSPMSIFVRGLEPTMGRSYTLWDGRTKRLKRSPAAVKPILGIFPALDLERVVEVVLGLFVLLLTYDAVCGEKEQGTLRLLGSFPTSRYRLLLGKFVGLLMPILAAFGLPLLLGVGVVAAMPGVQLGGVEWMRLGLIFLVFGLYLMAFTCAGLLASSLTRRPATSFVLLLAFWVASVAVFPRVSLIAADRIRVAPSVYELQAKKSAVSVEAENWRHETMRQWETAYEKKENRPWYQTPEGREAYRLYYSDVRRQMRGRSLGEWDRLDETFNNRYQNRLNLAVLLGRLSPAFSLNNAAVHLAETGIDRHRRFKEAAFFFRRETHQPWLIKTKDLDWLKRMHPAKYGEPKWDVSDMPRFVYHTVWPEESVQTAMVDMGILALWAAILFGAATVAISRYDFR